MLLIYPINKKKAMTMSKRIKMIEVTEYICDKCGHVTTEHNDMRTDKGFGSLTIHFSGTQGGIGMDGSVIGNDINKEIWICRDCMKDFLSEW